jgi:hypothetical protein
LLACFFQWYWNFNAPRNPPAPGVCVSGCITFLLHAKSRLMPWALVQVLSMLFGKQYWPVLARSRSLTRFSKGCCTRRHGKSLMSANGCGSMK